MRGAIEGLGSAHPLGARLPAVYAEDHFAQRFAAGLDALLSPLLTVLDCLEAYFRPGTAPNDFVAWLGGWVGVEFIGSGLSQSEAVRREAVAVAVALHRRRGTRQGLAEAVRLAFGVVPEISESGAATWSPRPLGAFPGEPGPRLRVTLRVPDPSTVDLRRLDAVVAAARPAHLPYTVAVDGPAI
jgi:phage tail-like protein